jgi:hypothetical protein
MHTPTKIRDFYFAMNSDEDILRLNIAMNNVFLV